MHVVDFFNLFEAVETLFFAKFLQIHLHLNDFNHLVKSLLISLEQDTSQRLVRCTYSRKVSNFDDLKFLFDHGDYAFCSM